MISVPSLIALGLGPTQAKTFLQPITDACLEFSVNTLNRQAAFVAQCAHESGMFVRMEESLYYRDPDRLMRIFPSTVKSIEQARVLVGNPQALANTVYANRNGNGDYKSGDGWKFRGRSPLQITGRTNYTAAALAAAAPFVDKPEMVIEPYFGCLASAWFFKSRGCNELADRSDIDAITKAINGTAKIGKLERAELYRKALMAFR